MPRAAALFFPEVCLKSQKQFHKKRRAVSASISTVALFSRTIRRGPRATTAVNVTAKSKIPKAQSAASARLCFPVFSIMFGSADPTQLEELAELTHARVFDGREDLIGAFRSVKGYN